MNTPSTVYSTKLFYKKYPYKITYKRLYGFPSAEIIEMYNARCGNGQTRHFDWWWCPLPESDEDKDKRKRCYSYLKNNFKDIKVHNVATTCIYFLTKDDFERAKKRYKELHVEYTEPFIEELPEITEKYPESVEFKKSLYFKNYRYRVTLAPNDDFRTHVAEYLAINFADNENYRLNKNILVAGGVINNHTVRRYIGYYHTYNLYCKDRIDLEFITFVISECIAKISKVVLIEEIDK